MKAWWLSGALVAVAALAALVDPQAASLLARGAGLTLALASLVVLTGWGGQLNLHVAAIGLGWGAYAAAWLAILGLPPLAAILLAPVLVAPLAAVIGVLAVRFRGLELAIATLATGLAFEQALFQQFGRAIATRTAGSAFESSLVELARPGFLRGDTAYAWFAVIVAALGILGAARFGRGRTGRILAVVRRREVVAEARGVAVAGWRVAAFVVSITLAAVGGALLAGQSGAVSPDAFGFTTSLQLLAVATVLGVGRLDRAVWGAGLVLLAQEAAAIPGLSVIAGDRSDLVFGVGLLVVLARQTRRPATTRPASAVATPALTAARPDRSLRVLGDTVLRVEGIDVAFGTQPVLRGVSLRVRAGEIVGLTGANGAGKSTLFNVITGLLTPQAGRVFFAGEDVTDVAPHRRAQRGLARTFQGVEVFADLSIADGLRVTAEAHGVPAAQIDQAVADALEAVGAGPIGDARPADLGFTTLRLVEIASALIGSPRLVLLDEPLAGLDPAERGVVLAAIERTALDGRAMVLVEHDHDAVDAVADRVVELAGGRIAEREEVAFAIGR